MGTATARAYQPYFAGRFMPSRMRKIPQNKAFYGLRDTYSRKAHCIKDSVLLDPADLSAILLIWMKNSLNGWRRRMRLRSTSNKTTLEGSSWNDWKSLKRCSMISRHKPLTRRMRWNASKPKVERSPRRIGSFSATGSFISSC